MNEILFYLMHVFINASFYGILDVLVCKGLITKFVISGFFNFFKNKKPLR